MARTLDSAGLEQYRAAGYYHPLDILSAAEAAACRDKLEAIERAQGHPITGPQRSKSHLLYPWVDELVRHPAILDAVEAIIGPDILCWNSVWWIKEPMSDAYVAWHQDERYVGLDTRDFVTAWLALSPATLASGCMRILPGSHREPSLPHVDLFSEDNMLSRGQEIAVTVDESRAVAMELAPGQISLHNVGLAHASAPNRSADRRIGLSLHYIPTSCRQLRIDDDTATLVRGADCYHHFKLLPRPVRDGDAEAVRLHTAATDAFRAVVFKDAARVRRRF
ncbi:MAG: phytanoyl-CoA dioxygenase family protein [Gammaproteobacteria bacterium]|nr:phytanoyl-CoA dioxygenase family protein [Gammaproteobacteria bacterium]MCP5201921.1 phytanoyl-CoA dioxygenase family protein [Gammaproteobacteria bacterium]